MATGDFTPSRLTQDIVDAWLVASEELLATKGNHEDDGQFTRGKAIRYVVATAVSEVNDLMEGLRR